MDNRNDLVRYRMEHAQQCLRTAIMAKDMGDYRSAANRSYYAIFHSIRAVLALEGVDFKKHSGVFHIFNSII